MNEMVEVRRRACASKRTRREVLVFRPAWWMVAFVGTRQDGSQGFERKVDGTVRRCDDGAAASVI